MTPETAVAMLEASLARNGESVTLRRLTGTNPIPLDVAVTAFVKPGQMAVEQLTGDNQFTHAVTMGNREIAARQWPGPPTAGDQVIRGGDTLAVLDVFECKLGGVTVRFDLACKA
jgi:hypothetical protein